ncbi:hypothetical protein D9611_014039 [Ephemerocybe angulata]|uniref:Uncharacterized protein n=1 Tax=Ephemerocybe angulata TaxID=980116 RepID=A0A8H5ERG3_9AGAR|nr:hypothetical protein D9611_014039 [Tulosesus angulatus]
MSALAEGRLQDIDELYPPGTGGMRVKTEYTDTDRSLRLRMALHGDQMSKLSRASILTPP